MERNATPSGNRVHIGVFGLRNAGKSSVMNAITGQNASIVSEIKGATTDPVSKAMELLPAGPVVITDTPGLDDEGPLGEERMRRALRVLDRTDVAVLVVDAAAGLAPEDRAFQQKAAEKGVALLTVYNKCDLHSVPALAENELAVSARTGEGIVALKERLAALARRQEGERKLLADLLAPGDMVVLVTPIDASAPKGRIILPQVQAIRDILDAHAMCAIAQPEELPAALAGLAAPPRLVVTDSQAFGRVKQIVPEAVPLTSFSILFARFKGVLETAVRGAAALERLRDGDRVLIAEGCTHHRQCEDIGTVKLPGWIRAHTGKTLEFAFTSGGEFPEALSGYSLVVHCGGCMLNEREMRARQQRAVDAGVPYTNYGTIIAYMNGILRRSLSPFPQAESWLNGANG